MVKKQRNEEFYGLKSLSDIIRVVKYKKIRLAVYEGKLTRRKILTEFNVYGTFDL
jgi:hypothetical protein